MAYRGVPHGLEVCAWCRIGEVRGFYYQHEQRPHYKRYGFCSMACLDQGSIAAWQGNGVMAASLTDFEARAVKDARYAFAAALEEAGLMGAFADLPAETIDKIILACVSGFRLSMGRQSLNDGVPF